MREQAELERGHVAHADPARAARHAPGDPLPVDAIEQSRQAIAAAGRERNARPFGGDAVQRRQPRVVVACEALHALGRRGVDLDREAELGETRRGTPERDR